MCLAIPGQIIDINNEDTVMRTGKIRFGGVVREVCLACVPEAGVGDYVLVHAGFALGVIDPGEADATLAMVRDMADPDGSRGDCS
jgi:hydrogenase expression/formation protein HypC